MGVPEYKIDVINEIEANLDNKFNWVEEIKWNADIEFIIERNRVTGIGLYSCGLSTFPESIVNLKSLKVLDLYGNNLSIIPDSIGKLKSLQVLTVYRNHLSTLPKAIMNLRKRHQSP